MYTITIGQITILLPTNASSDDDSAFGHDFGAESSFLLTRSPPQLNYFTISFDCVGFRHSVGILYPC